MTDPLEQAMTLLAQVKNHSDGLRQQKERVEAELHTARRRLGVAKERIDALEDANAKLQVRLDKAERKTERQVRATRDHVSRTA